MVNVDMDPVRAYSLGFLTCACDIAVLDLKSIALLLSNFQTKEIAWVTPRIKAELSRPIEHGERES